MSAVEYRHRVQVLTQDAEGRQYVLPWRTVTVSGQHGEAASFVAPSVGDARQVWRRLDAGDRPRDLLGSLDGWAGVWVSPVLTDVRYASSTGKSSWSSHSEQEGTWPLRFGVFADEGEDPRKAAA